MPATSPRLTITLHPATYTALKRLSEAQARPLASVIRELLDLAAPTVEQMAGAILSMKALEASARAELGNSLADAYQDVQPHLAGILGHLQALADAGQVDQDGEGPARPASTGAPAPLRDRQPPACNTGVVNG